MHINACRIDSSFLETDCVANKTSLKKKKKKQQQRFVPLKYFKWPRHN